MASLPNPAGLTKGVADIRIDREPSRQKEKKTPPSRQLIRPSLESGNSLEIELPGTVPECETREQKPNPEGMGNMAEQIASTETTRH